MIAEPIEIEIEDDSETGRLLARADERPLRLVRGGTRYRVVRESVDDSDDPLANYDPERAAAAWRASFGTLSGIDIEELKRDLKKQRGQDSVGRPRR
jgi:hypothetical protein